jgi:hypothetical protein
MRTLKRILVATVIILGLLVFIGGHTALAGDDAGPTAATQQLETLQKNLN